MQKGEVKHKTNEKREKNHFRDDEILLYCKHKPIPTFSMKYLQSVFELGHRRLDDEKEKIF